MKRNIGCPCGKKFSVETPKEIDLDKEPGQLENIISGTFMSFTCPQCEKIHKPEFPVILIWQSENIIFEVLPELERMGFYLRKKAGSYNTAHGAASGASFETIIGYREMADRIAVIKDNLEPAIIETIKYYLLLKAEENYPDKNINVWYNGIGSKGIEMHLDGIKAGEVAVMNVPLELYEQTLLNFRKNPKDESFSSLRYRSYLSVQNIYKPETI
jgi:hypothetical protein